MAEIIAKRSGRVETKFHQRVSTLKGSFIVILKGNGGKEVRKFFTDKIGQIREVIQPGTKERDSGLFNLYIGRPKDLVIQDLERKGLCIH